jgi:GMP synthase-like glutamine amidotransferase
MAPRCIHIAVLDTDVPVPTVYAARGLYSSQFRVLLQAAAARLNASGLFHDSDTVEVHTTAYDVVGGILPPLSFLRTQPRNPKREYDESLRCGRFGFEVIDAILITGSSASAYRVDRYPWIAGLQSFIQTVYAEYPEVQIFGSCFGHQIVAQALLLSHHHHDGSHDEGNYVSVAACPEGYEVGIHPMTLNPAFVHHFPVLLLLQSRLPHHRQEQEQGQGQMMKIQLIHGDRVTLLPNGTDLPSPWLNIGSTAKSPIQGLYHPGRVLTYQGHFEFDAWVNRETCIEFARREGWSATDLSSYLAQIGEAESEDDDAKIAAEVVVMFLAGIDVQVDKQEKSVGGVVQVQQNGGGGAVSRNGLITPPLVDDDINEQIVDLNMMA